MNIAKSLLELTRICKNKLLLLIIGAFIYIGLAGFLSPAYALSLNSVTSFSQTFLGAAFIHHGETCYGACSGGCADNGLFLGEWRVNSSGQGKPKCDDRSNVPDNVNRDQEISNSEPCQAWDKVNGSVIKLNGTFVERDPDEHICQAP